MDTIELQCRYDHVDVATTLRSCFSGFGISAKDRRFRTTDAIKRYVRAFVAHFFSGCLGARAPVFARGGRAAVRAEGRSQRNPGRGRSAGLWLGWGAAVRGRGLASFSLATVMGLFTLSCRSNSETFIVLHTDVNCDVPRVYQLRVTISNNGLLFI